MTQPAPTPVLARRIWIFPIWLWLVLIILAMLGFIWWKRRQAGQSTDASSILTGGPGVVTSPNGNIYYSGGGYVAGTASQPSQQQGDPSVPGTEPDPPATNSPPPPPPATTQMTYTVKSGDTLERIAALYNTTWANIAYPNEATMDAVARQHGYASSHGGPNNSLGWWIFPGEVLVVPS